MSPRNCARKCAAARSVISSRPARFSLLRHRWSSERSRTSGHVCGMSVAAHTAPRANAAFRQRLPFALSGAAAAALSLYIAPNVGGVFGALLAIAMTAIAHRDAHEFIIPDQYLPPLSRL